jgi:hypothetical protein
VIGTPHFFSQKITKNAQKRLMTFWLGLVKIFNGTLNATTHEANYPGKQLIGV